MSFCSAFGELLKCATAPLAEFSARESCSLLPSGQISSVTGFSSSCSAFQQAVSFRGFLIFDRKLKVDVSSHFSQLSIAMYFQKHTFSLSSLVLARGSPPWALYFRAPFIQNDLIYERPQMPLSRRIWLTAPAQLDLTLNIHSLDL